MRVATLTKQEKLPRIIDRLLNFYFGDFPLCSGGPINKKKVGRDTLGRWWMHSQQQPIGKAKVKREQLLWRYSGTGETGADIVVVWTISAI